MAVAEMAVAVAMEAALAEVTVVATLVAMVAASVATEAALAEVAVAVAAVAAVAVSVATGEVGVGMVEAAMAMVEEWREE